MPTQRSLAAASGMTGAKSTSRMPKSGEAVERRASSGNAPAARASRKPVALAARRGAASTMPSPTTIPKPGRPFRSKLATRIVDSAFLRARCGGVGAQLLDGRRQRQRGLVLRSETAQRHCAFGDLALADREDDGNLREAVLAHFVIDLLVAQIGLGAQARSGELRHDLLRIAVGIRGDRRDDDLQRRQPERQRARVMLEQDADEPL